MSSGAISGVCSYAFDLTEVEEVVCRISGGSSIHLVVADLTEGAILKTTTKKSDSGEGVRFAALYLVSKGSNLNLLEASGPSGSSGAAGADKLVIVIELAEAAVWYYLPF
ncbi:hypothetical protein PRIC1_001398 [Phytophthora ramorum]